MKPNGWTKLEDFLAQDQENWSCALQKSACEVTGEIFVRKITGRYQDVPKDQLQQIVDETRQLFQDNEELPMIDKTQPLWVQAEFLENILDFETTPPCGCASTLPKHDRKAVV